MGGKTVYVIRVTNESGDDFGEHTFSSKPSDEKLEARLREIGPGDWDYGDGPGEFGSYLHVEHIGEREIVSPAPRKSLAGPRGRKLRALCAAAKAQSLIDDPSESKPVRLRFAPGVKWPAWAEPIANMNVAAIEAVLDALGVA